MNYKLHYERLINRAKSRKIKGYKEKHHIIPKCMGGSDSKNNLVELTAREHFIAHLLLVKIYPNQHGLIKAVQMLCFSNSIQERSTNRMYGQLKEKFAKEMSLMQSGEKNSQYGKIQIYNPKEKISKKINKNDLLKQEKLGQVKGRYKIQCKLCGKMISEIHFQVHYESCYKQKIKNEIINTRKKQREDYAKELFQKFLDSNLSLRKFAEVSNYKYSHVSLTKMFKKYIINYSDYIKSCSSKIR